MAEIDISPEFAGYSLARFGDLTQGNVRIWKRAAVGVQDIPAARFQRKCIYKCLNF